MRIERNSIKLARLPRRNGRYGSLYLYTSFFGSPLSPLSVVVLQKPNVLSVSSRLMVVVRHDVLRSNESRRAIGAHSGIF